MNSITHQEDNSNARFKREIMPVEMLITNDQRRLTVQEHHDFRQSIATPPAVDEIDELIEELRRSDED